MAQSRKRVKYSGRFLSEWTETFNGVIIASKLGENYAFCKCCNKDVKVAASGIYDIREHLKSKVHQRNSQFRFNQPSMTMFAKKRSFDVPTNVLRAEVMMCNFIAQHNLPMSVADHLTDLLPKMFEDSATAKQLSCKRTKTTQIIKKCLAPDATQHVIEHCRKSPFSVMIDESNDQKCEKRLAVLVRIFDLEHGVKSRILDMPVCNIGTSENIFNVLEEVLR